MKFQNGCWILGKWLDVNGESIYGSQAFELPKDQHDWGKITYKPDASGKHKIYLHIFNWPYNHQLPLTGITTKPVKAFVLSDKSQAPLSFSHNEVFTNIHLPALQPDPLIAVVVLEYDQKPEILAGLVSKTVDGGYSLDQENKMSEKGERTLKGSDRHGTVPGHLVVRRITNRPGKFSWKNPQNSGRMFLIVTRVKNLQGP
ncbi:MAG: hypothetical protein U5K79_22610 [Cyclobacteriaceae bacterium]|nr:hypothetical protein [Cyclobacteriaceae bacterium]